MKIRVGQGYDVHQLVSGRPLILGGVTIAHDKGLLGHSDADALLHAITDALLGAAALGGAGRNRRLIAHTSGCIHLGEYPAVGRDARRAEPPIAGPTRVGAQLPHRTMGLCARRRGISLRKGDRSAARAASSPGLSSYNRTRPSVRAGL